MYRVASVPLCPVAVLTSPVLTNLPLHSDGGAEQNGERRRDAAGERQRQHPRRDDLAEEGGVHLAAAVAPAAVAPATAVAIGGEGWAAADAAHAFRNPLVFVAFLQSFAHGANDTANATSAFAAVWAAHSYGLYACSSIETPWWIMSAAGALSPSAST